MDSILASDNMPSSEAAAVVLLVASVLQHEGAPRPSRAGCSCRTRAPPWVAGGLNAEDVATLRGVECALAAVLDVRVCNMVHTSEVRKGWAARAADCTEVARRCLRAFASAPGSLWRRATLALVARRVLVASSATRALASPVAMVLMPSEWSALAALPADVVVPPHYLVAHAVRRSVAVALGRGARAIGHGTERAMLLRTASGSVTAFAAAVAEVVREACAPCCEPFWCALQQVVDGATMAVAGEQVLASAVAALREDGAGVAELRADFSHPLVARDELLHGRARLQAFLLAEGLAPSCARRHVVVARSAENGQGVFTTRACRRGHVLTTFPAHVLVLRCEESKEALWLHTRHRRALTHLECMLHSEYMASIPGTTLRICGDPEVAPAWACGHMVNDGATMRADADDVEHSRYWRASLARQNCMPVCVAGVVLALVATRDLARGEECFTCYGGNFWRAR